MNKQSFYWVHKKGEKLDFLLPPYLLLPCQLWVCSLHLVASSIDINWVKFSIELWPNRDMVHMQQIGRHLNRAWKTPLILLKVPVAQWVEIVRLWPIQIATVSRWLTKHITKITFNKLRYVNNRDTDWTYNLICFKNILFVYWSFVQCKFHTPIPQSNYEVIKLIEWWDGTIFSALWIALSSSSFQHLSVSSSELVNIYESKCLSYVKLLDSVIY